MTNRDFLVPSDDLLHPERNYILYKDLYNVKQLIASLMYEAEYSTSLNAVRVCCPYCWHPMLKIFINGKSTLSCWNNMCKATDKYYAMTKEEEEEYDLAVCFYGVYSKKTEGRGPMIEPKVISIPCGED